MTQSPATPHEPLLRAATKNGGLLLFAAAGRLARRRGVPVLGYHSVDGGGSPISISPHMFRAQMDYLCADGWTGVSLRRLLDAIGSGTPVPPKTVAITFDDGLRNFAEQALPILKCCGFSATNFVPTGFIGQKARWYESYGMQPQPVMDWQDLKDMDVEGMDIQSHGCRHTRLVDLTRDAMREEAVQSRAQLEDGLGKPVELFCYPFGDVNQAFALALKEAGYVAAAAVMQGLYRPGEDDAFCMRRLMLDYIGVNSRRTAVLSMQACLRGTFADYVRFRSRFRRPAAGAVIPQEEL